MKKEELKPLVRNLILHQSFIIVSKDIKTVIPIFEIPQEWYLELQSISIASTLYYERCLAGELIGEYKSSEIAFYLADAGEKMIPNVLIMPTAEDVVFNPPLVFQRELNLIIAPYIQAFKKEVYHIPIVYPPELQKVPVLPFPYRIEVTIRGVLKTRWMG